MERVDDERIERVSAELPSKQQTALIVSAETGYYDILRAVMRDTVSTYLDISRRSLVDCH